MRVVIRRGDPERKVQIELALDSGETHVLGSTDYDQAGWAGLELLESVAERLAEALDAHLTEEDLEEVTEDD